MLVKTERGREGGGGGGGEESVIAMMYWPFVAC